MNKKYVKDKEKAKIIMKKWGETGGFGLSNHEQLFLDKFAKDYPNKMTDFSDELLSIDRL